MNEDEFFDFDDNVRTKRRRLFSRNVFFKHLDRRMAESGVLRHTEKISPVREDGSSEEITLVHEYRTDCQCIGQEAGAACIVCGRIFCVRCVGRLKSHCSVCGGFCCPQDYFPGFGDENKGYCRRHRFHWRRLITG